MRGFVYAKQRTSERMRRRERERAGEREREHLFLEGMKLAAGAASPGWAELPLLNVPTPQTAGRGGREK